MSEQTATIASLCVSTHQSLIVFAANFFTIAVFWIHRNKLRRTYLLLINLAVADLLVGFAYMTPYLKALALPSYIRKSKLNVTTYDYLVIQFQVTFLSTSMFFSYFSGTCICFNLAASSSKNKHEDVHLRWRRRLVNRCFFGFINLAG